MMAIGFVADVQRFLEVSRERSTLLEKGQVAVADVVSVKRRERRYGAGVSHSPTTDYETTYTFRDRHGRLIKGRAITTQLVDVGMKLEVAYLPDAPHRNIILDDKLLSYEADVTEFFYQGFGVFIFLVLTLVMLRPIQAYLGARSRVRASRSRK